MLSQNFPAEAVGGPLRKPSRTPTLPEARRSLLKQAPFLTHGAQPTTSPVRFDKTIRQQVSGCRRKGTGGSNAPMPPGRRAASQAPSGLQRHVMIGWPVDLASLWRVPQISGGEG